MTLRAWIAVGIAAALLAMGVAVKVQTTRLHAVQAEYAGFKAQVRATGEAQSRRAKEQAAADKQRKDDANAKHAKTVAALTADVKRLRHERDAHSSGVPAAPPGSSRPDLVCFERAEYQRAYGAFVARVRGLADEGTAATVDLDTAKAWAVP